MLPYATHSQEHTCQTWENMDGTGAESVHEPSDHLYFRWLCCVCGQWRNWQYFAFGKPWALNVYTAVCWTQPWLLTPWMVSRCQHSVIFEGRYVTFWSRLFCTPDSVHCVFSFGNLQLVPRSRKCGSIHPLPIRLHGVVLNWLSTGITLPLPLDANIMIAGVKNPFG
jgi:hypothetical protein